MLNGVGMKVGFMLGTQKHGKNVIVGWLSVRCKAVEFAKTQGEDLINYMCSGSGGEIGRL